MTTVPLDQLVHRYTFCDPAGGRIRQRRTARSAIVTVTRDPLGRVFTLDAWAEKCPTSRLIERIFETYAQWEPVCFGIEANAMQALFADTLVLEAKRRNVRLPLRPVVQKTAVDKHYRIRATLQPLLARGQLFIQKAHPELRVEIENFPTGRTVDLVDALASAVDLMPPVSPAVAKRNEQEALRKYLERTGAPEAYIQERTGLR